MLKHFGVLLTACLTPPTVVAAQATKPLALVREVSIGQADGPPEYAFGSLGPMAITATGAFFLFDYSDSQLRRYDPEGRFLGLVGRVGSGPGEYRQAVGLAMHGDSLLLVFDPANGRITAFDTIGKYRRAIPFKRGAFFGEKAFAVDHAGLIYVRASLITPSQMGPGAPSRAATPRVIQVSEMASQFVRLRLDGSVVDSIPLPVEGGSGGPFVLLTSDGARWSFPRRQIFNVLPAGGLVTANTGVYRITLAPTGAAPQIIERPYTPIPLAGAEREEWQAWAGYFAKQPGAGPPSSIPRVKPAIRDLFVDPVGRLWVNVYTTADKRSIPPRKPGDSRPLLTLREVNVYDLFDTKGAYLGRVTLPPQSLLMGVHGERIWTRTEAEGGEYLLTRYRVSGLAGS